MQIAKMKTTKVVIILIVALIIISSIFKSKVDETRFQSYIIAGIPYEIGSAMRENIRQYLITGDPEFLKRYRNLEESRDGTRSWEGIDDYDSFAFMDKYGKLSFKELIRLKDFTEDEDFHFLESLGHFENMALTENTAINIMIGYYDDASKTGEKVFKETSGFVQYTVKGQLDQQKAVNMLFTNEYILTSEKAYESWKKGIDLVLRRTNGMVNFADRMSQILIVMLLIGIAYTFVNEKQSNQE
jgi:hypothetical protein